MAAALAALLVLSAAGPASAEPLLSAPEAGAALPSPAQPPEPSPIPSLPVAVAVQAPVQIPVQAPTPAKPQTDALDCWLLAPDRLEQASGHGLCGDAFARAPETAALPEAPPPPPPAVTPSRKPKAPDRHIRSSGSSVSSSGPQKVSGSSTRGSRGGDGDFFSNFQRDFRALTNLLGGDSSPRRGDGGTASHMSHNH